jgi:hypothetical protein
MSSSPPSSAPERGSESSRHPFPADSDFYEGVDLREVLARLARGLPQILGFAALGLAFAAVVYLASSPFASVTTSMRVAFAFDGAAQGQYPDHSKFDPGDLRAPDVILDALKRLGLATNEEFQSKIRAAVTVEGVIPPDIVKQRDRLRAAGQAAPSYVPDEYLVTLTLPRSFPLEIRQRELLLNDIVSGYRQRFQRTYAAVPRAFGNAFESLHNADYFEYEIVLDREVRNIADYLNQQLEQARTFRSPTTNLSFSDLLKETALFQQIRLNETLGLIRENGLSRDRYTAMIKMDYYLRILGDQEREALEQQKVVQDLLANAQSRSQNVVLGIKSQVAQQRPESPVLDQGLIDSLLANDAYSFLVRRALDAGLAVTRIQSEKTKLVERRKAMESFLKIETGDQSAVIAQVNKSLGTLESAYNGLITSIRNTYTDFARQQFADAIRVTMAPATGSKYKPLAVAGIIGGFLGVALGMGLSLLGIYVGAARRVAAA